jgi:hypothetical protein
MNPASPRTGFPSHGCRWLFFVRHPRRGNGLEVRFVAGDAVVTGKLEVDSTDQRSYSARGVVGGSAYRWQAEPRRELDGVRRSAAPMFAGTFAQEGGTEGTFHVRRRADELLTLGVFGAPHSVSGNVVESSNPDCAVIIHGLPELEVRLEHSHMYSPPTLDDDDIRAAGDRNDYAGYCLDPTGVAGSAPPALSMITSLVLIDALLVREFYLRRIDL